MTTYSFTLDPSLFADGDYTFEVIATDASSNANVTDTTPVDFTISNVPIVAGPPGGRPAIQVEIALGQGPFTVAPTWTDVTADVLMSSQISITRGATADNPQPTPGVINFTLLDKTRTYDPDNADGPYFGQLTYGCPTRVLANFTNLPAPIVDASPIVDGSPIVTGGGVTSVQLAYGLIDGFPQSYPDASAADKYVTVPINAPGVLSVLARTSFLPVHPFTCATDDPQVAEPIVSPEPIVSSLPIVLPDTFPDYMLADVAVVADPTPYNPQEKSGSRIQALCELAGIPDDFLDIDDGQCDVEEGTPQETNLLDHFRTVVLTEYGRLDESPTGQIRFRERRSNEPRLQEAQALFCEIGGLGIAYATLDRDPADRRFLFNRCIRSSQSVPQVLTQDDDSIGQYGPFEDSQTLVFADPQDAVDQTEYVVGRFAQPQSRITGLTIKPDRDPSVMYPTILALDTGNWYAATRTPLGIGAAIADTVTAEQIKHTFDQTQWLVSIDAGAADTDPYFTADDPSLGLVDAGNLVAY